jgi:hypothetical protein
MVRGRHKIPFKEEYYLRSQGKELQRLWKSGELQELIHHLDQEGRLVKPSEVTKAFLKKDPAVFKPTFDDQNKPVPPEGCNVQYIIPRLEVKVNFGEVLFFTGDLVHAGALYSYLPTIEQSCFAMWSLVSRISPFDLTF